MSLQIDEVTTNKIIGLIRSVSNNLKSSENIRKCLAGLPSIARVASGIVEINDNAETRFAFYMLHDQLGNVQGAYDGNTDEWYKLNEQNVESLRKILTQYLEATSKDIQNKDYSTFIDHTKTFFNEFHPLARMKTMDIRPRD